jgi:tRNA dimethylallyltransferase
LARFLTHKKRVPVIVGPTAVGKSSAAVSIARQLGYEILSCDSRQVYRYMDIGTDKPSPAQRAEIPHWLVDIVDPDQRYSAFRFAGEGMEVIREADDRDVTILVCGGTGLYLKRLMEGIGPQVETRPEFCEAYEKKISLQGPESIFEELRSVDPETANRVHPNNTRRIMRALQVFHDTGIPLSQHLRNTQAPHDVEFVVAILSLPRPLLYQRINDRVDLMVAQGLSKEFAALRQRGYGPNDPGMNCVGYRELFAVEEGIMDFKAAVDVIKMNSRRYAKRQITWFAHQTRGFMVDMSDQGAVSRIQDYFTQQMS